MNRELQDKLRPILLIVSVVVLLVSIISITCIYRKRVKLTKQVTKSELRVRAARSAYRDKAKEVAEEANKEAETSKNPALNTVARQNYNHEQIQKISNEFFRKYYTWSDYSGYLKRAKKLSKIITPALAHNKTIFDDGKDKTGGNYIQSLGLQSRFESAKGYLSQSDGNVAKVQALVRVTNESWYNDEKDASGEATHYYDLTYNLNTNKISSLRLVFTEKDNENEN